MGKREPASAFLGRRYGKLVITEVLPNTINGRTHAIATCDCGETWTGRVNSLKSGNTKSCGCDSLTFEDFTGLRFNRWTALECVQRSSAMQQTLWKCRCDCGRVSNVQSGALKNGLSKSCGCFAREQSKLLQSTHKMKGAPEYNTWTSMKQRCLNPRNKDYKNYGARGITIFQEWADDFLAFYRYVGPRPAEGYTLEREDNDGNYEPGNVSWQPLIVQANNNRGNRHLTIEGVTKTLAQWCREFDRHYGRVHQRINISHWDPIRALMTPTNKPNGAC